MIFYLIDSRGKRTHYDTHVSSVELKVQENQVQAKHPNLSLVPKDFQCVQFKGHCKIPLQGLPAFPSPLEVSSVSGGGTVLLLCLGWQ